VDFGGSSAKVGLVDRRGGILAKETVPIDAREDFERIVEPVESCIEGLAKRHGDRGRLIAIGVGTPGFIEEGSGRIVGGCENIPALQGRSLPEHMGGALGVPVFADNDANCAAAGELAFGAGRRFSSFAFITLGTGIGGGLVFNKRIFRGARGFAAEIGHMSLDPSGLQCNCGSRGCLEQYASGPAIVALYQEKRKKRELPAPILSPKEIADRARGGDSLAVETFDETGRWIAQALGTLLNLLNLEACILGGGISQAGDVVLEPVRRHLPDFIWPIVGAGVSIIAAHLSNDAGILGAAAQALERLER
jgi:glucokinase